MPDPELPDPGLDPDLPGPGTDLADELRALGRSVVVAPVPDDLAERVLARVPRRRPHPVSRMLRRTVLDRRARRRLVAVVVAALLVGLLLTPPVRAAVVEWFRVGGILFSSAPAPTTAPTTRPTTAPTGTGSDDPTPASPRTGGPGRPAMVEVDGVVRARDMVDFPVALPDGLGEPTR
ncbi:MAG TPA: hypothetical protein VK020_13460, partial [Microlunatus sp.]|nr:hypothetical protein [Microlunatus sp.]